MGLSDLFNPKSIAIIGASKTPGKIGNALIKNVINSGYKGKIYLINPKEKEIEGLRCYSRTGEIRQDIDLAIVAIPAALTPKAIEECGLAGVKKLIVISAGFKEIGREGLLLEKELLRICRKYKMQMLGPNCVGMMDTHMPINASFSGIYPKRGDIAFISQSGAILLAILDWSQEKKLGFSKVISLGNKADLNETDFIEEAANDPHTKVILCYIEDVAEGIQFLKVARAASRIKPVIVLKSGTSQAGARAASSHTGALAGSDLAYETAFRQTGVIRAQSMSELFDLAAAFTTQPLPQGNKIAIVTNAGGPGIITTDAIEKTDLKIASFEKKTIETLRKYLPSESAVYNPVDVLGDGSPKRYRIALENVLSDKGVDSAVILVCPTAVTDARGIAQTIIKTHRNHPNKPLFTVFMGGENLIEGINLLNEAQIPCFTFPEPAIVTLSGMARFKINKKIPINEPELQFTNIDKDSITKIIERVKKEGRLVLLGSEGAKVGAAYGIPVAPTKLATSPEEAVKLAEEIGFPVVLKVASPKIMHKTDVGGIKADLRNTSEVKQAFLQITDNIHRYLPKLVIHGIEVQKMMPKGTELIIGMSKDIQFGPLIAFGLGGIYVNLLKDVAFRLTYKLTKKQIQEMITETKAYTLLRGYRGEKPADIKSIIDVIARVAKLTQDFPQITEMDINPLFAYPDKVMALDIKIIIS